MFQRAIVAWAFLFPLFSGELPCTVPRDSLSYISDTLATDSLDCADFLALAREYGTRDRLKAIEYYTKALDVEKDTFARAVILDTIGLYNWHLGHYRDANRSFKHALVLFEDLQDSVWLGKVNNNIGVILYGMEKRNKALTFYQEGLKIRRSIKDQKGVSTILNNIGLIYQDWGLFDEAFQWHEEALEIAEDINNIDAMAYSYSNLGICSEKKGDLGRALDYNLLGFKTHMKKAPEKRSYAYFQANIGNVYFQMDLLDSALLYNQRSLWHAGRINNKNRIAIAEYQLGKTHFHLNNLDSARYYITRSYKTSNKYRYRELIMKNQFLLAELEELAGRIPLAYEHFRAASTLKDKIVNEEEIAKFSELQLQYNLEQEEKENMLLRKNLEMQDLVIHEQNVIRFILIVGSLLILAALIIIAISRASFIRLTVQLRKSEKELRELNAGKDKFFSIISHDLKSPVNGLKGIADLMDSRSDTLTSGEIKEFIHVQKVTATNLSDLLEGLLEWARTVTGRMPYNLEEIALREIGETVKNQLIVAAREKEIKLINRVDRETRLCADRKAVEAVIRNLMSNSVKFTESGGEVILEASGENGQIEVSVSDTGIGMTPSEMDKLFRIDVDHSSLGTCDEPGTGLGLILCKELVKKQKGTIWVESEKGVGSTFSFALPKNCIR